LAASAQHRDRLALDQIEVDRGAEAGIHRRMDKTVAVDLDAPRSVPHA
jgi:hypothetical protein